MIARKIYITEDDFARLTNLVGSVPASSGSDARQQPDLRAELNRAIRVPREGIPADVITMNSTVVLCDLKTGKEFECTVVYPGQADVDRGRISVLAPIGTALIGYRKGDTIEWKVPGGTAHLKVVEILYQPEAASGQCG